MRRLIAAIMIAATAAFVMATSQGASASDPAAESDFVGRINALRTSQGAGTLQTHSVLTAKAQAWAAHMAATNCLCHSNLTDGISVGWRKLGENVGRGPSVASLHSAFIGSSAHLANMVDRQFQWVGVGVAYGGGQMWVAEVFMNGDPPPAPAGPIGSVENVKATPGAFHVSGWAINPQTTAPDTVHVYIDGGFAGAVTANGPRADIGAAFSAYGANHGFSARIPTLASAQYGAHNVCAFALGGNNPSIGCKTVVVQPWGYLEKISVTPTGFRTVGWAVNPLNTGANSVHFYIDGMFAGGATANIGRGGLGNWFNSVGWNGYGDNHTFAANISAPGATRFGPHTVCAYALGGPNPGIGCRVINVQPWGYLEQVSRAPGGIRASGWAVNPQTSGADIVHLYVDGVFRGAAIANGARGGLGDWLYRNGFAGYGNSHVFSKVVPAGPGSHVVCAYALGGNNPGIGCRIA